MTSSVLEESPVSNEGVGEWERLHYIFVFFSYAYSAFRDFISVCWINNTMELYR